DGIQYEAFGISTINHESSTPEDWQGLDGGTVIRDCLVHECCPASYCSAISLAYRPIGPPLAPSISERCVVRDFADHSFSFSASDNTTFRDCYASGMRHGFYNDTEGVDGWLIDHCEIHSRRTAIYICGLDSVPGHWRKCNVRATNSTFGWEYEKGTDK